MKTTTRLCIAALFLTTPLAARVTRVEVQSTTPAANGYEIVRGVFHGEVDPTHARNKVIVDLGAAPRNVRGKVEYAASFEIARPVDPAKRSGVLFYDVPNRGRGAARPDPDGHVRVVSGWQGDVAPVANMQWAKVPVATGVTGEAMARFVNIDVTRKSTPMIANFAQVSQRPQPVSLDTRTARVMVERNGAATRWLRPDEWAFADCETTPFPGKPDPTQFCLKDGFAPDTAYTLGYRAKDPQVLGLGFAITRDLVAYLRSGKSDDAGNANPAGTGLRWAIGAGMSQSGNFLRTFVHLGFNQDEDGTRVFDGINPNIAARQLAMNIRFAVPGSGARLWEPGSEGTLWWGRYDDVTRRQGASSLLDRCTATRTCPKVVETLGSAEFWGLRASPNFVGTDAKADIPLPDNVRRYYFPGVTHGGSRAGGFPINGEDDSMGMGCTLRGNPNPSSDSLRVAQHMLVDWVKLGKAPLPSRYPTLAAGDLVAPTAAAMGWPAIPGAPKPDGLFYAFHDYDFGKNYDARNTSGTMLFMPPHLRRILPSRVPRVNADGNETSGVPSVHLLVPLGTYTGWNVQAKGYGAGGGCGFAGGFIPFAKTRAAREATGDPRLSLEERYGDHAGFVAKIRAAVAAQEAKGWLLPEDAARIIAGAEASEVLR